MKIWPHIWLPVSTKALPEIFSDELIWPTRNSALLIPDESGRYIHSPAYLSVYARAFKFVPEDGRPALFLIDAASVDDRLFNLTCEENEAGYYAGPIYLKHGSFQLYFEKINDKMQFKAISTFLLGLKTADKYLDATITNEKGSYDVITIREFSGNRPHANIVLETSNDQRIQCESRMHYYDGVKGLVIAWIIHRDLQSYRSETSSLARSIADLSNKYHSFRTYLEMKRTCDESQVEQLRKMTSNIVANCPHTLSDTLQNVFTAVISRLDEIVRLQAIREMASRSGEAKEAGVKHNITEAMTARISNLETQLNGLKTAKHEAGSKCKDMDDRLKDINATKPSKGSGEWAKKQEMKSAVESIKQEKRNIAAEIKRIKGDIKLLKHELKEKKSRGIDRTVLHKGPQRGGAQREAEKYDTAITAQFERIDDVLNNLHKHVQSVPSDRTISDPIENMYYCPIKLTKVINSRADSFSASDMIVDIAPLEDMRQREKDIFQWIVNHILILRSLYGDAGEQSLMLMTAEQMLADTKWALCDDEISCIASVVDYLKGSSLEIKYSSNNQVLNNYMACALKYLNPEDIQKLVELKGMSCPYVAFALYGAIVGFRKMPKTFTKILYDRRNLRISEAVDRILVQDIYPVIR